MFDESFFFLSPIYLAQRDELDVAANKPIINKYESKLLAHSLGTVPVSSMTNVTQMNVVCSNLLSILQCESDVNTKTHSSMHDTQCTS